MFVYTEPMNTNEHTSYDVVLLLTYAEALSYRKRVAAEAGPRALFGVTVATFPAWIADLWELFGDGRVIASPLEVEALSASLCSKDPAAAGCARVVTACLQSAGIPTFDEACARAKRGEDCGVTSAQAHVLRLCADVRDALRGSGRVLAGEALKMLPGAMPSRPLRLLVECSSPLSAQQRAFLEACPLISYEVRLAPGGGGIHRAPEGVLVRFAFPSGSYAEPATLRDVLCGEDREGALVACKEPLSLFEKLAPALAEAGLSCAGVAAREEPPVRGDGRHRNRPGRRHTARRARGRGALDGQKA